MEDKEWKELSECITSDKRYVELLKKTRKEEEHPEWYDSSCECQLCMSYAD